MTEQPTGSSYDTFILYRAHVIRAIALAWQDAEFKHALLEDPKQAMHAAFGYEFPFDMDLRALDGSAYWNPTGTVGWTVTAQNTVRLVLPPKPEAGQEAVALAEYNARHLTFLSAT
jgi:ribosomally synthesized peptide (two-chain TOMM family)